MTEKKNNVLIGCLCALGCENLYGLSYIFTKKATEVSSPFALLGWRFLIAAILMTLCALTGLIRLKLKGKNLKPLLLVAIFSPVIYFIGETIGINNTTASESGVFLACIPVASLVASALILKKKPARIQVIGVLITLVGVLVTVFAAGASSSFSASGYAFLLIAVISYALYCVFVEKATDFSGAEVTYVMLIAGAIVFVLLALAEALCTSDIEALVMLPVKNVDFLMAIMYQGVGCSILAFFLSNVAISKIGVNRTSSFIGVATVVSIIAGALMLKESLSIVQVVGAVIIIAGVYTANAKSIS